MNWQRARVALLTGVVLAGAALAARGGDHAAPIAPAPATCCAPATRTVCVTEWVPEQHVETRTVYKTECAQEAYTAYRTECVPEVRKRIVTVNRMVPEVREVV